jgi:UDP-N-acetylglucosamine pyrophosphorylase
MIERSANLPLMAGIVDETFVGGITASRKGTVKQGTHRMDNKTAVGTLVSRDGEARSQAVERVNRENLTRIIAENVDREA